MFVANGCVFNIGDATFITMSPRVCHGTLPILHSNADNMNHTYVASALCSKKRVIDKLEKRNIASCDKLQKRNVANNTHGHQTRSTHSLLR